MTPEYQLTPDEQGFVMILLETAIRNQFAVARSQLLLNKIQRHILIANNADPRVIPEERLA
jgi:hypothetical protein